jgi:hypothetical protein
MFLSSTPHLHIFITHHSIIHRMVARTHFSTLSQTGFFNNTNAPPIQSHY